jgi:hypothetical protein
MQATDFVTQKLSRAAISNNSADCAWQKCPKFAPVEHEGATFLDNATIGVQRT